MEEIKYPSLDSEDLAEFIGIILGDGYFVNDRLKISLNSISDLEYLDYVKNLITYLFNVDSVVKFRKNENCVDLFIFKRKILRFLESNGLIMSPKWKRAKIPADFLRYGICVLRGYFDTDGCVVITNNNGIIYPRLEMKVCPSPMQKQFIDILKKENFHFGVYQIGRGQVRIQLNGKKQLELWNEKIGFKNMKHVAKVNKFL